MSFKCKVINKESNISSLLPPPLKFIWDPDKANLFVDLLELPQTQAKLCSIHDRLLNEEAKQPDRIDAIIKDLSELLFDNANKCFKLKKKVKKKSLSKTKPTWFNNTCQATKKRFKNLAKLLQKNPKDPYISGQYLTVKKEYKQLLKDSKRKSEIDAVNKLNHLTSAPKAFWKQLKKINNPIKCSNDHVISPEVWINHFSKLNSLN